MPRRLDPSIVGTAFYVYVHQDAHGQVFYVGKGKGHRAWEYGRDPLWNHYVETHLHRKYDVRIVEKNLSEEDALEREEELMGEYGDQLVNLQNMSRGIDMEALARRDELTQRGRELATSALLEADARQRVQLLEQAMGCHLAESRIIIERGLVGRLLAEMPSFGNTTLLQRLVDALLESADKPGAQRALDTYLEHHPQHRENKVVQALAKAVARGAPRRRAKSTEYVLPIDLPSLWERAPENGVEVVRLRRDLPQPTGKLEAILDELQRISESGDWRGVLAHLAGCIVRNENAISRRPSAEPWLWAHHRAVTVCFKLKDTVQEGLFLQRLIHHLRDDPAQRAPLELRLRRCAAKVGTT